MKTYLFANDTAAAGYQEMRHRVFSDDAAALVWADARWTQKQEAGAAEAMLAEVGVGMRLVRKYKVQNKG